MKHNPALDGLRALAVLLVIVFHAAAALPVPPAGDALVLYRIAKVGWIGVDLFFVLSGYLITSILLNSKTDSLKRYCKVFYARRALRIFPLYFVFVPAVLILLSLFGPLRPTWNDWLIHLTYGQNSIGLYLPSHVGPFLGHTWSLAVEEWFYLLWPFFVFFASPPKLRRIALFGLVGILTLRLARADPGLGLPIYSSFFTNFDALMVGALLALSGPSRASRIAWIAAGAIAFGAFVGARLVTSDAYKLVAFNNGPGSTLIAFGAAALITICIGGANRIAKIFALRPLAGMGRIS
jgi:peptidoglycan/LPS O-acetylase OafA/YrhL